MVNAYGPAVLLGACRGSADAEKAPSPSATSEQNCERANSRFYAGNGGERSEQIALRSHDADLVVGNFNSLGQGAEMVAIPLHADCSPLHRSTAAELSCARCNNALGRRRG